MIKHIENKSRSRAGVLVVLAALATSACEVVNPGRILDTDLNNEQAMRVLVNGIGGDVTLAYGWTGWDIEVLTGGLSGTSAYDSRIRHWRGDPNELDAEDYNSAWSAGLGGGPGDPAHAGGDGRRVQHITAGRGSLCLGRARLPPPGGEHVPGGLRWWRPNRPRRVSEACG